MSDEVLICYIGPDTGMVATEFGPFRQGEARAVSADDAASLLARSPHLFRRCDPPPTKKPEGAGPAKEA